MTTQPLLSVTVAQGKYTIVQHTDGRVTALRYGQDWDRDLVGDGLVLALAQEVESLRNEIEAMRNDQTEYRRL